MKHWLIVFALLCLASILLSEGYTKPKEANHILLENDSISVDSSQDSITAILPLTGIQDGSFVPDERQQIDNKVNQSKPTDVTDYESDNIDPAASDKSTHNANSVQQTILVILVIVAVILCISLYYGFSIKCKKCGRMWAGKVIHSKVVRTWMSTKNVKKTDIIRDKNGQQTGTIEREETVPVSYSDVMYQYKCKYCGAIWTKVRTHEN